MKLSGRSILGSSCGEAGGEPFHGFNPATGEKLSPAYYSAAAQEIDHAACLAHSSFAEYGRLPGKYKGAFLRTIAARIEALGPQLAERATQETALPAARIQSETARTCNQLRMFAEVAEEGSWVDARIDHADQERKPLPKPDVRSMLRPLGPVAVFGASNFPLAFSVAGGDTASALAAGNPVVVKAHPAHPGTAELVGHAIEESINESGMPEGVFSLLFDGGIEVGKALVRHPLIKAVGFTGSRVGGRDLMDLAAARPNPIPVYAEMSSANPVFILPGAMREHGQQIATGLHASVMLGAGQFCTKPGIVLLEENAPAKEFAAKLGELMAAAPQSTLLTAGIRSAYQAGVTTRSKLRGVQAAAVGAAVPEASGNAAAATLFETDAGAFLHNPELSGELFGPSTLLVRYSSRAQLLDIAHKLEGHLTATVHGTETDLREYADLLAVLETKVGRVVFNGYPTGVEVCHSMVHGGPYPATSDGRTTSVGTRAITRFARLVCYQGFPDSALPDELKEGNPLALWRMVDGKVAR